MLVGLITRRSVVQIHAPLMNNSSEKDEDAGTGAERFEEFLRFIDNDSLDSYLRKDLGRREVTVIREEEIPVDSPAEKFVVKRERDTGEVNPSQNLRAVTNYLEASKRGYDFFPEVYCGRKDLNFIVTEYLETDTNSMDIHPDWKEIGLTEGDRNVRGEVLTHWGHRGNQYKVPVDMGMIIPKTQEEYNHLREPGEISDAGYLPHCQVFEVDDNGYFVTKI